MSETTQLCKKRNIILISSAAAMGVICSVVLGILLFKLAMGFNQSEIPVNDLKIGNCFSESPDEVNSDYTTNVVRHSCGQPYKGKIYAITEINLGRFASFPAEDTMREIADSYCFGNFYPAIGETYEDSNLDYSYYYPAETAWEEGDRILLCYSYPMDVDNGDHDEHEHSDNLGTYTALRSI